MVEKDKGGGWNFHGKRIALGLALVVALLMGFGGFKAAQIQQRIKTLFEMNKRLKEQNYYMAEFEFKMLGIAYCLDKGAYARAFALLDRLDHRLRTREGLIKMPAFSTKAEELDFYLNLQNPRTGAFMDDAYPLCTYHGPTENVLIHMDALAKDLGKPLRLKYPLRYLDAINTPEKLIAFLDDISTVGWLAARLPQTTFHNARDILTLARDGRHYNADEVNLVMVRNGLNPFPAEWRRTLLQWFYDRQDPQTGLWGPRSKRGELLKQDLSNTASILKAFVDGEGRDIHTAFPLRYRDELFQSILELLEEAPLPADDELHLWHEWDLRTLKGLRTLTRYLWRDASTDQKARAAKQIENFIRIKFERHYIPAEGGFSLYPGGRHATLDGMGGFFILKEIGAFSHRKQARLWGFPRETMVDLGTKRVAEIGSRDLAPITTAEDVNSLRFYAADPHEGRLTAGVAAVVYPQQTAVLDVMALTAKLKTWIDTTPQTMGNWVSKEEIQQYLAAIEMETTPVLSGAAVQETAERIFADRGRLVVVGFDALQVPRYKMGFVRPSS